MQVTAVSVRLFQVLVLATAVLGSTLAGAATYYVDSVAGNDANAGTSTTAPWKTIAKVNAKALAAGDTVLLKRGGFWREQINVTKSGSASARITYGAYGTGALPILCGSDPVTGWTQHSGNVWKAPYSWSSPSNPSFSVPDMVFVNGNVGLKKTSVSALTAANTWYYSSGTLYVYSTSTPTSIEIGKRNYGVIGNDGAGVRYITVEDLEIMNANYKSILIGSGNHNWTVKNVTGHHNGRRDQVEDGGRGNDRVGFSSRGNDNILITGCTIYQAGENGIQVTGGSNNIVEYCTVYDTQHHGIDMKGDSSKTCTGNIIRYNTVFESPQATTGINAIVITDDGSMPIQNSKVYGNVVYNISDIGYLFYGSDNENVQVFNNTAYNCHRCYVLINMASRSATIKNNVGLTTWSGWNPVFSLEDTSTANKVVDYNCWYNTNDAAVQNGTTTYSSITSWRSATGFDAHSVIADPKYVNASAGDFHLQATSPAVDKGTSMGLATDQDGIAIPQGAAPDMGAYERTSGQTVNTPPVITLLGSASVTVEVDSAYTDAGATASDAQDGNITSRIVKTGTVNTGTLGTYTLTYNVTDSAGAAATPVTRTVRVVDTTKPVITLLGSASVTITAGATYTDAGATANDNYDGNITSRITKTGTVNAAVAGAYTLTYNVSDAAGNAATPVMRTVTVVEPTDTIKPVITLLGSASVSITAGATYTDAGATAMDNKDGDITPRIVVTGTVNAAVAGTYALTYNVSDAAGNAATPVTRTVTVVELADTIKPVITLLGGASLSIAAGATYIDAGATATDNKDGNITERIVVTGKVDTAVAGTYTLTYNVSDAAGNTATPVTRTVTVVKAAGNTAPVITLNGSASITLEVHSPYTDAGAKAMDAEDGDLSSSVTTTGTVTNWSCKTYTLTYNVTDSIGLAAAPVTRTVTFVDTTPPVITLLGQATVTLAVGDTYTDAGATAWDNYDWDITPRIVKTGTVNAQVPGTYTITYSVEDYKHNYATPVTRTVTVKGESQTSGTVYYVDSAKGNDSKDGKSAATAWRTMGKVNNAALVPGDSVLFKRDGFWRNQLVVTKSGAADAPITYGAYGTGADPIICGSDKVTGWTLHDSARQIWKAPYKWESPTYPSFSTVDLVFIDGEVAVKKASISAVTGFRNWYYANGTLYVNSATSPKNVEVAKRNYGIIANDNQNAQYIVVKDLMIKNVNYKSILVGNGNDHWTLENITAHRNGRREDVEDGGRGNDRSSLAIRGCNNTLITGCTVYLAGSNGIQILGGSNNTVENCTVWDSQRSAISVIGSATLPTKGNIVRYNLVYQRPQTTNDVNGIVIADLGNQPLSDTEVYGNVVNNFNDIGIFIYGAQNNGTKVYNNTAYNCHRAYCLMDMASCSATVKNNIGVTNLDGWHPVFSLDNTSTSNKIVDYNLWLKTGTDDAVVQNEYTTYSDLPSWRSATGFDANSILADPRFVNAGAGNFELSAGSPAIDEGAVVGLTEDFMGTPIPQGTAPDMGAYEY